MPAVQFSLSGEGGFFLFLFYLRYTQRAHCDRSEQRATVLLQVGWSLGVMEVGQAKYMGVLPLPVLGVDGGYSHCAVDGSHGTNGQGVAWKEGKKGENNLLFGTEHL